MRLTRIPQCLSRVCSRPSELKKVRESWLMMMRDVSGVPAIKKVINFLLDFNFQ